MMATFTATKNIMLQPNKGIAIKAHMLRFCIAMMAHETKATSAETLVQLIKGDKRGHQLNLWIHCKLLLQLHA